MDGFYGRILRIDLNNKAFHIEELGDEIYEKYLGGKGLASYLLYELNPPGVDPLAPENNLILATGPVTGSAIWGSCRYGAFTKSPQTGFYAESYSGGRVPEAVDSTGFDAIVIQGKSADPAVLAIHPEGADFHDGGDLWGMGTSQMVKVLNNASAFPTRYWTDGRYDGWEKISAETFHKTCEVKPHACLKCFMACGRMTRILNGRHAGLQLEGPEYETIYAFGGLCLVDSIEEIAYLNDICDILGMDTISAGNLCGFTIEAARRGKVDYRIDYGDVDAIAELLRMIARREGIGDILANGIRFAAKEWGLEDIAVHVKGMEPAGYDPRALKGMGLAYATSDRGACHLRTTFYKPELSGMISPDQVEGKAKLFLEFEDRLTIFDTLVFCRFYRDLYQWEMLGDVVHATTGLSGQEESLRRQAADISNLIRRFNVREGLKPEDDRLPKAFYRKFEHSDHVLNEEDQEFMLKEYYALRGWDEEGKP
jgi:aldehyde:ferredoxin oxidoreductase